MRALLLAAGLGTRLRPITNTIPKCLVPINQKPLLSYWLDNLSEIGIKNFLINTHYFPKQVENFVENSSHKKNITLIYEEKLLNTAGTILDNEDFFNHEPFMLVHADNLSFCDFKAFLQAHKNRPKNTEMTMMLFKTDSPQSCGIVELDEDNVVQAFHEKVKNPPSNLANGAVYICEPTLFEFLKSLEKREIDFSLDVIPNYMGRINTFINHIYHRDIGTPESLQQAQKDILKLVN